MRRGYSNFDNFRPQMEYSGHSQRQQTFQAPTSYGQQTFRGPHSYGQPPVRGSEIHSRPHLRSPRPNSLRQQHFQSLHPYNVRGRGAMPPARHQAEYHIYHPPLPASYQSSSLHLPQPPQRFPKPYEHPRQSLPPDVSQQGQGLKSSVMDFVFY